MSDGDRSNERTRSKKWLIHSAEEKNKRIQFAREHLISLYNGTNRQFHVIAMRKGRALNESSIGLQAISGTNGISDNVCGDRTIYLFWDDNNGRWAQDNQYSMYRRDEFKEFPIADPLSILLSVKLFHEVGYRLTWSICPPNWIIRICKWPILVCLFV